MVLKAAPKSEEIEEFWEKIWSNEKVCSIEADCTDREKERVGEIEEMEANRNRRTKVCFLIS